MGYEIIQVDAATWRIEDSGHVRFFLLTGTKEALLIDSGMTVTHAKEIAESLTKLPIRLLNTHADRDHVGSNHEFEAFYMHPSEASNYYNTQGKTGSFLPVQEGDVIDLGDRSLEIIALPGHTPGSIGILDINKRVLFSGDPIQDGMIFMFGVQREMHAYLHSLKKLDCYRERFDVIYPSHGTFPVRPELIDALYDAAVDMMNGKYEPSMVDIHGTKVECYDVGAAKFLRDRRVSE